MKQEFDDELTPIQREKMKKNLVYIGIFSVIMIFAGLTSGYIVSMNKSFWVKYDFPQAFWVSTVLIVISSIVLAVGIRMAQKQRKPRLLKIFVPATFLLGLGFAWSQWMGYGQLIDNGAYLSSNIVVYEGRYGDYYQLKIDGKYMDVDGSRYLIAGEEMPASMKADVSQFAAQFDSIEFATPPFDIAGYGKYTLLYKSEEVTLKNGKLYVRDSVELQFTDLNRLSEFAAHLRDGRGDFFHKGELGKDFHVYYNGQELTYKDRKVHYKGKKLDAPMQMKMNDSADTATSYLYIITFLHLLHILGTLIYMFRMSILSFTGNLEKHNYLSIRTGAIFWHFLGVLWIYLLLFLLFIH